MSSPAIHMPVALGEVSEPEPGLAVVSGEARQYLGAHPSRPVLVVEVADATLHFDRDRKRVLYARHGVQEYWIVNLPERRLEVHRGPEGEDFREARLLIPGDEVSPRACLEASIPVAELLP